jgi:RND family efflux transporter MFP subunit
MPENRKSAPANGPDGQSSNGSTRGDGEPRSAAGGHDEHAVPVDLPTVSTGAAIVIGVVILVLFGGLFALGWFPHTARLSEARADAAEAASDKPVVDAAKLKRSPATFDLNLPGDVRAYQATAIFARTSGYLDPLPPGIDIGAEVEKGEKIASITAPEVDAELAQAKAALDQAEVTIGRARNEFDYNKGTYERYTGLAKTGGVTDQQLADRKASFNIAESSLKAAVATKAAAVATYQRLEALKSYQTVTAPFDGVITTRNYDAGAAIAVTAGSARELFQIKEVDRLRVVVNVPQTYVADVRIGQEATLTVPKYLDRTFKGVVARASGSVDPATRTMRVEVDVDNRRPDEKWNLPIGATARALLRPLFQTVFRRDLDDGTSAKVKFKIGRAEPPLLIPTSALIFGAEGSRVAVIDAAKKVHFKTVIIGRDFGSEAEIAGGLNGDELIVMNPGERLADGVEVEFSRQKNASAK